MAVVQHALGFNVNALSGDSSNVSEGLKSAVLRKLDKQALHSFLELGVEAIS